MRRAEVVALGLLQGPAELLPVSSSAHLAALPWLLGWEHARLDAERRKEVEVALHAGAALALLVGLRRELLAQRPQLLALSLAPPVAAGLAGERFIERRLGGPRSLAAGLLAGSAALVLADRAPRPARRPTPAGATGSPSAPRRRARWCPACRAARPPSPPPARSASGARTLRGSHARSACRCWSERPR